MAAGKGKLVSSWYCTTVRYRHWPMRSDAITVPVSNTNLNTARGIHCITTSYRHSTAVNFKHHCQLEALCYNLFQALYNFTLQARYHCATVSYKHCFTG